MSNLNARPAPPWRRITARMRYVLANGWEIILPAVLHKGDAVELVPKGPLLGKGQREATSVAVAVDEGLSAMSTRVALETLSDELLGPKVKRLVLEMDGTWCIGLDSDAYSEMKLDLGYGVTRMPLDANEQFRHGRFRFYVAAAHDWQQGRPEGQALS